MTLTYDDFFHVYFVIFKIFTLYSLVFNQQEFLLAWVFKSPRNSLHLLLFDVWDHDQFMINLNWISYFIKGNFLCLFSLATLF